eukprot:8794342-Alexandrium_andersonii.AAC.1
MAVKFSVITGCEACMSPWVSSDRLLPFRLRDGIRALALAGEAETRPAEDAEAWDPSSRPVAHLTSLLMGTA